MMVCATAVATRLGESAVGVSTSLFLGVYK
jgi:hypothetical protein